MVLDLQFFAGIFVPDLVSPAADLATASPVCRTVRVVQAQVAFAGDGHAECTVREHFDFDRFAVRTADIPLENAAADRLHLREAQFACQYHHVGILRVKCDRFDVRHVQLRGDVDFETDRSGVENRRLIRCDHGVHAFPSGPVQNPAHFGQVFVV